MSYLEELLPEFRKGAKIRCKDWYEGAYICCKCEDIWNQDDELVSLSFNEIRSDKWELYQEPIDWDYIIKNKCLCLFWDDEEIYIIGTLVKISEPKYQLEDYKYKSNIGKYFKHCRPVRRDEVTFYEDREDD